MQHEDNRVVSILDQQRPIALLKEPETNTSAKWLQHHLDVQVPFADTKSKL
ncbi:MAG: hypothetical protein KME27_20340 [Lyngbya sp. HA4199-MV5]|jgi:hypothetical protein|nr:hypothetical protein [Lyngbya sp. HA4199-MV5]